MRKEHNKYIWRFYVIITLLLVTAFFILWRLFDLNIVERSFLLQQSHERIVRDISIPAYRGMILDSMGYPLAISSPMDAVWVNPKNFSATVTQKMALARELDMSVDAIDKEVTGSHHEFIYLKRQNPPVVGQNVLALHIPGVYLEPEYKRFYPEGEVTAHILGLTNVDDEGQEGLELVYNKWLSGAAGKREVVKDRKGSVIKNIAVLKSPIQGHDLVLSIDHRIQYVAYSALKEAVSEYNAVSGSIVVLNVKTGEVLAMANAPSYNPNDRPGVHDARYRNRAATDMFEPGSVMKPFDIAFALESDKYHPSSIIDTSPGRMRVGGYLIEDDGLDYGPIDLTTILEKSSNVGAAKILMSLPSSPYWDLLHRLGFGEVTGSGFPGESAGRLVPQDQWYPSVIATLAYGYGIAVTTLQLAHAYGILANHGVAFPVSLLKLNTPPKGMQVINSAVANNVIMMLEAVVNHGSGFQAKIPDYRVAGKTGTAYLAGPKGYDKHRYISSFVGMAPASNPQLVVAVQLNQPQGQHFGGLVSAPVFAKVMSEALRILDIAPDGDS